jgi:hypothetical protein
MLDYRRGIQNGTWQRLWHFVPSCPSYPARNFQIQRLKPDEDELCSRCWNLSREEKRVAS